MSQPGKAFQIIAQRFDEADVTKTGRVSARGVDGLMANICSDFGTEIHFEPGESVEGLVMATGADSILFMDFIKLLDQEPLRSGLPEVAKGEIHKRALVLNADSHYSVSLASPKTPMGSRPKGTPKSTPRSTRGTPKRSPERKARLGIDPRPVIYVLPNDGGVHVGSHQMLFYTLNRLCELATQKLGLPRCGRRVFTTDGVEIKDKKDIKNGETYVVSGGEAFKDRSDRENDVFSEREPWNIGTAVSMYGDPVNEVKEVAEIQEDVITPAEYVTELFHMLKGVLDETGELHKHDYEACNNQLKTNLGGETVNRWRAINVYRCMTQERRLDYVPQIEEVLAAVAERLYIFVHCLKNDGGVDYDYVSTAANSWKVLLREGTKKLGLAWGATRLFTHDGEEIVKENFQEMVTENGMDIIFSMGEDFVPREVKPRHPRFGEFKFSQDVLDMTPQERNSLNPIVAEGYAHTRTAPFCRSAGSGDVGNKASLSVFDDNYKPAARNAAHFALKLSARKPYHPPQATRFKEIPDVDEPGTGTREVEKPSSMLKVLSVHRHDEDDACGSEGLPWEPEAQVMMDIENHYHDTLTKQRERAFLDNFVDPTILRGRNLKVKKPEHIVRDVGPKLDAAGRPYSRSPSRGASKATSPAGSPGLKARDMDDDVEGMDSVNLDLSKIKGSPKKASNKRRPVS